MHADIWTLPNRFSAFVITLGLAQRATGAIICTFLSMESAFPRPGATASLLWTNPVNNCGARAEVTSSAVCATNATRVMRSLTGDALRSARRVVLAALVF